MFRRFRMAVYMATGAIASFHPVEAISANLSTVLGQDRVSASPDGFSTTFSSSDYVLDSSDEEFPVYVSSRGIQLNDAAGSVLIDKVSDYDALSISFVSDFDALVVPNGVNEFPAESPSQPFFLDVSSSAGQEFNFFAFSDPVGGRASVLLDSHAQTVTKSATVGSPLRFTRTYGSDFGSLVVEDVNTGDVFAQFTGLSSWEDTKTSGSNNKFELYYSLDTEVEFPAFEADTQFDFDPVTGEESVRALPLSEFNSTISNSIRDFEVRVDFKPQVPVGPPPGSEGCGELDFCGQQDPESAPDNRSNLTIYNLEVNQDTGLVSRDLGEFNPDAPTIVLTHGWQPNGTYEETLGTGDTFFGTDGQKGVQEAIATRLRGEFLQQNTGSVTTTNVLVYEWAGAYTGDIVDLAIPGGKRPIAEARLNSEWAGQALGASLKTIIGDSYEADVHFIGHSFGTVVNAIASQVVPGSVDDFQFTSLDAPVNTLANILGANLRQSDYAQWLAGSNVDYFDNFYSNLVDVNAFGEDMDFQSLTLELNSADDGVGRGHSGVFDFYADWILDGSTLDNAFELNEDWVSPLVGNYVNRHPSGNNNFTDQFSLKAEAIGDDISDFVVLGSWTNLQNVSAVHAFDSFGISFVEASPAAASRYIEFAEDAIFYEFEYAINAPENQDWISLYFDGELLWQMGGLDALTGVLLTATIDISEYAGQSGYLSVVLNSVGEADSEFFLANSRIISTSPVPLPAPIWLLVAGIGMLGVTRFRNRRIL